MVARWDKETDTMCELYMARCNNRDEEWVFPEKSEVLDTSREKIIAANIEVKYINTAIIKCRIASKDLIRKLNLQVRLLEAECTE